MMTVPESDLHRISYLSSARRSITKADLEAILDVSRRKNEVAGITGLLLYHDGSFFQTLEGMDAAVREIFASIRGDQRHRGIIVMEQRPVGERLFGRWSMAFKPIDELSAEQLQDFLGFAEAFDHFAGPASAGDPTAILIDSFLASFRDLS